MSNYKLVVLCGPAGSGKDYLIKKVKDELGDKVNVVVADTTRPPRLSEVNGVEYNFLTPELFFTKAHLEVTNFNHWYYGTPMDALKKDKVNLLVLNPSALLQVYRFATNIDLKIFKIEAPDKVRMIRQLERSSRPDVYEICRRFLADHDDFLKISYMPCDVLTNYSENDGKKAVECLIATINSLNSDLDKMS